MTIMKKYEKEFLVRNNYWKGFDDDDERYRY